MFTLSVKAGMFPFVFSPPAIHCCVQTALFTPFGEKPDFGVALEQKMLF